MSCVFLAAWSYFFMHSDASDWLGPSEERNIFTAHASKILQTYQSIHE